MMRSFARVEKRRWGARLGMCSLLALFAASWGTPSAVGQMPVAGGADGISATGTAAVELEPQRLRLNMWVQAQGKDARSAVQSLAAHKERVKKELEAMKADVPSLRFSATRLGSGEDEGQGMQAAVRMMRRQMGGPSRGLPTGAMPAVYTAKAALQVEWPLPTTDRDALALLPQGLLDQIATRDFAGEQNQPELSEEEREQFEEMQAMIEENFGGYSYRSDEESAPRIVFVATADREQRLEATKQAFERARESASLLAVASGAELGPLRNAMAAPSDANLWAMQYGVNRRGETDPFASVEEGSVAASSLDGLRYAVTISTVYAIATTTDAP